MALPPTAHDVAGGLGALLGFAILGRPGYMTKAGRDAGGRAFDPSTTVLAVAQTRNGGRGGDPQRHCAMLSAITFIDAAAVWLAVA